MEITPAVSFLSLLVYLTLYISEMQRDHKRNNFHSQKNIISCSHAPAPEKCHWKHYIFFLARLYSVVGVGVTLLFFWKVSVYTHTNTSPLSSHFLFFISCVQEEGRRRKKKLCVYTILVEKKRARGKYPLSFIVSYPALPFSPFFRIKMISGEREKMLGYINSFTMWKYTQTWMQRHKVKFHGKKGKKPASMCVCHVVYTKVWDGNWKKETLPACERMKKMKVGSIAKGWCIIIIIIKLVYLPEYVLVWYTLFALNPSGDKKIECSFFYFLVRIFSKIFMTTVK